MPSTVLRLLDTKARLAMSDSVNSVFRVIVVGCDLADLGDEQMRG
jgi:hypothetical protein